MTNEERRAFEGALQLAEYYWKQRADHIARTGIAHLPDGAESQSRAECAVLDHARKVLERVRP